MSDPLEWEEMVLAKRVERDRARDHELVVPLVVREGRRAKRGRTEKLGVCVGDPARRVAKGVGAEVLSQGGEEVANRPLSGVEVDLAAAWLDPRYRLRLDRGVGRVDDPQGGGGVGAGRAHRPRRSWQWR